MSNKKRLNIIRFYRKDKDFMKITDSKNNTLRIFEYDEKIKKITNFNNQKRANEESLLNYFKNKSDKTYNVTSKKEYKKEFNQFKDLNKNKKYEKDIKTFFNENRLIFSNKKTIRNYNFMYINVKVKIFLNGFYVYSHGRSNYFYKDEYPKGIPVSLHNKSIQQAVLRAIAPFGSSVKFELITWKYVYHQRKYQDFGEL